MGRPPPAVREAEAAVGAAHRRRRAAGRRAAGPLRPLPADVDGGRSAPPGWVHNCSLWAPLIAEALAPWWGPGAPAYLNASALDVAFWAARYTHEGRAGATPGAHVSVVGGRLHARWNSEYRDDLFRDMMKTVGRLVRLPDVEFVAHLWDHPKVPRGQPLPVLAHYADAAHTDVPMPAPWAWDVKKHAFPQPHTQLQRGVCAREWRQRDRTLYFRGGCNGPTRGWRGPIWRFYPRKRANALTKAAAADGGPAVDAGVYDHCDSPKLTKAEWGWDAEMEKEMWADAPKRKIEPFGNNCRHRHLLHVDGNAASSRLASELHTGSTVFKAASASTEYFYPLLKEWEHYVPVQANLADARARHEWALAHPRRAEAIAAAGAKFAKQHLHTHGVACYWWQLLSALAELEGFRPRSERALGFRPL